MLNIIIASKELDNYSTEDIAKKNSRNFWHYFVVEQR